jgi:hypothetical protein
MQILSRIIRKEYLDDRDTSKMYIHFILYENIINHYVH